MLAQHFSEKLLTRHFRKKNVDSENIDKLFSKNVDNISENVDQHFLVHEKY
jgi:hypothetical protein